MGLHQPFHSIRWATLPWAMAVGLVTWSFTTCEIPARETEKSPQRFLCCSVSFCFFLDFLFSCLASYSPWREDRANAAISWMVRALLDLGNISTVSSTFTWKRGQRERKGGYLGGSWGAMTHRKNPLTSSVFHGEGGTPAPQLLHPTSRPRKAKEFLPTQQILVPTLTHGGCRFSKIGRCLCLNNLRRYYAPA